VLAARARLLILLKTGTVDHHCCIGQQTAQLAITSGNGRAGLSRATRPRRREEW
jgi:hypothetical protein